MNRFNSELPRVELPEPPKTNWFSKYHLWGYAFLALAFLLIVAFIYQMEYNRKPQESRICIQVVTTARSPYSGETKEFPTPCDVPEGWEIVPGVYNEIPNLNQPQSSEELREMYELNYSGVIKTNMVTFKLPNGWAYEDFSDHAYTILSPQGVIARAEYLKNDKVGDCCPYEQLLYYVNEGIDKGAVKSSSYLTANNQVFEYAQIPSLYGGNIYYTSKNGLYHVFELIDISDEEFYKILNTFEFTQ